MSAFKILRKLDVDADATIELVEVGGRQLILKTAKEDEIILEKRFSKELSDHGIPHLELFEAEGLLSNQLLMEYADGSITVDKAGTSEMYKKWGMVTRMMHDVKSEDCIKILPDGVEEKVVWNDFISERLNKNTKRHIAEGTLDKEIISKVTTLVQNQILKTNTRSFSLIHGDLHGNNAMVRNNDVVLFDKGSYILYGNRLYDLAIIAMIYYGYDNDDELIASFVDGYGEDFLTTHKAELDTWVALRCFERHPNRFEPTEKILNIILGP